jgi:hypothetical protein
MKARKQKGLGGHYVCLNGPLAGKSLYLHDDGCSGIFTLHGWTGRYVRGRWEAK